MNTIYWDRTLFKIHSFMKKSNLRKIHIRLFHLFKKTLQSKKIHIIICLKYMKVSIKNLEK